MQKIKSIAGAFINFVAKNSILIFSIAILLSVFAVSMISVIEQRNSYKAIINSYVNELDRARGLGYMGFDIVSQINGSEIGTSTIVSFNPKCDLVSVTSMIELKSYAVICNK